MKIDLMKNSINAYDFYIRGEQSSGNLAGSYLLLSSSPQLVVHLIDSEKEYDLDLLHVSPTKFILNSANYNNKTETTEKKVKTGEVNVDTVLNIRSGPGTSYSDVGNLSDGAIITIYETKNGWYRISEGSEWVIDDYIINVEETTIKNEATSTQGLTFNVGEGFLSSTNASNSSEQFVIDTRSGVTHPLQIGAKRSNGRRNFSIGWDGSLEGGSSYAWSITAGGKATFKNLSITSYGNLNGCYIGNATISGATIGNAKITSGTIGGCTIKDGGITCGAWTLSSSGLSHSTQGDLILKESYLAGGGTVIKQTITVPSRSVSGSCSIMVGGQEFTGSIKGTAAAYYGETGFVTAVYLNRKKVSYYGLAETNADTVVLGTATA